MTYNPNGTVAEILAGLNARITAAGAAPLAYNPNDTIADIIAGFKVRIAAIATPTPAPAFTTQPTIISDGTPQVGEVAALDPGVVENGSIGTRRLFKDGADFADASAGSIQWATVGAYKLRVYIAGTSIFADSAVVTVAAAPVAGATPAPVLSIPDNFVSGTNPPRVKMEIPGPPFDKTLFKAVVEWDYNASGAFAYSAGRSAEIADLMAFADAEDYTIAGLVNQPAPGPFRMRSRFVRLADSVAGPDSNYFIDTLAAPVVAPAAFDPATKDAAIGLTDTNRTTTQLYPGAGDQYAYSTIARGIGAELTLTIGTGAGAFVTGMASATTAASVRLLLTSVAYVEVNGVQVSSFPTLTNGDTLRLKLVANADDPTKIDVQASKNGGAARTFATASAANMYFFVKYNDNNGPPVTITDYGKWS
ncbi:hypothetical protein [Sphingomonas endolithica]|uniref:hypothetical protein n=1 Tax=Sphingomonas endolithica TaxID=2972485 RepID=UPI0021AF3F4E|nr:hypothetical protein [Sphingomonas sp. ZFBP2030]